MQTEKLIQVLLGLVTTMSIALASFSLKWVFDANAQIAIMSKEMELKFADLEDAIITLSDDSSDIIRLNSGITKHWKLHNWTKDQLAELRHQHQLPPVSWPDLE